MVVRKHSLCGVEAPLHRREFTSKTVNTIKTRGKPSAIVQLELDALKLPLYICVQRQMLYLDLIGFALNYGECRLTDRKESRISDS